MSEDSFSVIQSSLPKCSPDELKKVKMLVDFFLSGKGEDAQPAAISGDALDKELLYMEASAALNRHGTNTPPWSTFTRLNTFKHFEEGYEELRLFRERHLSNLRRPGRQKLYRITSDIIILSLVGSSLPLKLTIFCRRLKQAPELVNQQFPGYAASGLLPMMLKLGSFNNGE